MANEKNINITGVPDAANAKEADVVEVFTASADVANAEGTGGSEASMHGDPSSQEQAQSAQGQQAQQAQPQQEPQTQSSNQKQSRRERKTQQAQNANRQGAPETAGDYTDRQAPPYVRHAYEKVKKNHTAAKVVWGLVFVAAAAAIILGGLGIININGFGAWDFIWAAIFVVIFIFSACHLFWFGVFFPAAGILLLFGERFIGIAFPFWTMLIGALLLSIGFHIFFAGVKRKRRNIAKARYEAEYGGGSYYSEYSEDGNQTYRHTYYRTNPAGNYNENAGNQSAGDPDASGRDEGSQSVGDQSAGSRDGGNQNAGGGNASNVRGASVVRAEASFNNTVKYINSDCLKRAEISSSFAAMDVYFDNTKLADNSAAIMVSVSFGSLNLYLPKEWSVSVNVENSFSRVDELGYANYNVPKTAHVAIFGDVSFSGMTITYI